MFCLNVRSLPVYCKNLVITCNLLTDFDLFLYNTCCVSVLYLYLIGIVFLLVLSLCKWKCKRDNNVGVR